MRPIFFLLFLLITQPVYAAPPSDTTTLKGIAVVRIKSAHLGENIFQQAVVVGPDGAQFVGLTDFGNVAFVVYFDGDELRLEIPGQATVHAGGKSLKRILSLPLNQDEFLHVICHSKPEGFKVAQDGDVETWTKLGEKKLAIHFSDFKKLGKSSYPNHIVIGFKNNIFDLKWQRVEIQTLK